MPAPTPPPSLISLTTVIAELSFIADYITDLAGTTAPQSDKDRIKALLATAQADLTVVVDKLTVSLGQNPGGGDQA